MSIVAVGSRAFGWCATSAGDPVFSHVVGGYHVRV